MSSWREISSRENFLQTKSPSTLEMSFELKQNRRATKEQIILHDLEQLSCNEAENSIQNNHKLIKKTTILLWQFYTTIHEDYNTNAIMSQQQN